MRSWIVAKRHGLACRSAPPGEIAQVGQGLPAVRSRLAAAGLRPRHDRGIQPLVTALRV
jgi:hypothetical protein